MLDEPADAECADRRRTAGLIIGQTMGGGKERRVLVLEILKQGLPLSGYRQRHRNHAASLRPRSGSVCSNDLTRPSSDWRVALIRTSSRGTRDISPHSRRSFGENHY